VVHDCFDIRGGGERVALVLAEHFRADLCAGYWSALSFERPSRPPRVLMSDRLQFRGLKTLRMCRAFSGARELARGYDLRIYSGIVAPLMAPEAGRGVDALYCHTPPRFLYDQRARYLGSLPFLMRLPYRFALERFEEAYVAAVRRMKVVMANSVNVQNRLQRFAGIASEVVYPPVDTHAFSWGEPRGYYLSCARHSRWKRVDVIVEAFLKMPHKQLVVVSGGEMQARIKGMAQGAPNIHFKGWVTDEDLARYVRHCIATIYIPIDEDFGMTPVESMAAGKPVIGVAEGGLLETVIDGKTGVLVRPDPGAAEIVAAVLELTEERARAMRPECEAQARNFSRGRFTAELDRIVRAECGR